MASAVPARGRMPGRRPIGGKARISSRSGTILWQLVSVLMQSLDVARPDHALVLSKSHRRMMMNPSRSMTHMHHTDRMHRIWLRGTRSLEPVAPFATPKCVVSSRCEAREGRDNRADEPASGKVDSDRSAKIAGNDPPE